MRLVFGHGQRARWSVRVRLRVERDPCFMGRLELRTEAGPIEVGHLSVTVEGRVDEVLEHAEVPQPVLVGLGVLLGRTGSSRGRLAVVAGLDAVPQRGLITAPRRSQRGDREEGGGEDLETLSERETSASWG